jgi:hypothetical protein
MSQRQSLAGNPAVPALHKLIGQARQCHNDLSSSAEFGRAREGSGWARWIVAGLRQWEYFAPIIYSDEVILKPKVK